VADSESLKDLIGRLSADADQIVVNPGDRAALAAQGIRPVEAPQPSLTAALDALFHKRRETALERAERLPALPAAAPPAFISLYDEIRECVVFDLVGAAITLCGILVEFTLKYATYIREVGGYAKFEPDRWDEFESITFEPAIKRAFSAGIITTEQAGELRGFKDTVRNPYNHYSIGKITSGFIWRNVTILDLKTRTLETKDVLVQDDPVLQAQAKPVVDRQRLAHILQFTDGATRALLDAIGYAAI